jgi:hypothetical protein
VQPSSRSRQGIRKRCWKGLESIGGL